MAQHGRTQDDLFDHPRTYGRNSLAGVEFDTSRKRQPGWFRESAASKRLVDVLTGMMAGAAATWVMTQYQVHSKKLLQRLEAQSPSPSSEQQNSSPTVSVADMVSRAVRGRDVSQQHKELAGNLVHYAAGTMNGAIFSLLRDRLPLSSPLRGLIFGAGVWAAADELSVPALGLAGWWPQYTTSVHMKALAAHLVYGTSLDAIDLGLRQLMRGGHQIASEAAARLKEKAAVGLKEKEESTESRTPTAPLRSSRRPSATRRFSRIDLGEAA